MSRFERGKLGRSDVKAAESRRERLPSHRAGVGPRWQLDGERKATRCIGEGMSRGSRENQPVDELRIHTPVDVRPTAHPTRENPTPPTVTYQPRSLSYLCHHMHLMR